MIMSKLILCLEPACQSTLTQSRASGAEWAETFKTELGQRVGRSAFVAKADLDRDRSSTLLPRRLPSRSGRGGLPTVSCESQPSRLVGLACTGIRFAIHNITVSSSISAPMICSRLPPDEACARLAIQRHRL